MKESIILPQDARESGIKVRPPQGCEIDEVKVIDGFLTVTFKEVKRKLPRSWEEFCKITTTKSGESRIESESKIRVYAGISTRNQYIDRDLLPDRASAEAVLALCQLIQLRNCYNGDWVPDWTDEERKYTIDFYEREIWSGDVGDAPSILTFKSRELRDEFLRNFRNLIEKLKPLYGIKEGGEE